jgi:diguanylate cyclase (GGDEF)-like protein
MALSRAHTYSSNRRFSYQKAAWRPALRTAGIVGALILLSTLFGMATRSASLLAEIWPTNAVLLGSMVRWPSLASPTGWAVTVIGLPFAEFAAAGSISKAWWNAVADFAGILTGYLLFLRLNHADRRLQRPMSILHLVVVVFTASAAAGLVGVAANPILSGRNMLSGWGVWLADDLVSYTVILPVVLTLPIGALRLTERRRNGERIRLERESIAPLLAVAISCIGGLLIGGPGAIAFPVPALLWCALTYSLFTTAMVTLLFSLWSLAAISLGHIVGFVDHASQYSLMSIRIGVALIALAPITVASVMSARNVLMRSLQHLATHDPLTALLNRRAFLDQGTMLLAGAARTRRPVAAMMLDIDHFKSINDTYGHGAGDQVLISFATTLRGCLREGDVLGRHGGEEFAVLLADCTQEDAERIAERVRAAFAATPIDLYDGRRAAATVSIGLAVADAPPYEVEHLLSQADKALYAAKTAGRDRVALVETDHVQRVA